MPDRLTQAELQEIIGSGRLADNESFQDWLNRSSEVPMDKTSAQLANYFYGLGTVSLRWQDKSPWDHDNRVSISYLIAQLVPSHRPVGCELDYLAHCYDWESRSEYYQAQSKWVSELWIEYHSAPVRYEAVVKQVLENTRIGEYSFATFLQRIAASTDIRTLTKVFTAIGIFQMRCVPDSAPQTRGWTSYMVTNLPRGALSKNPNMPPLNMAEFLASRLRNPYSYFLIKTELWVPLHLDPPLKTSS